MNIKGISDNVQALLNAMTDPDFVEVIPAPESSSQSFTGYPSATHFYQSTDSSYATVTQNRRVIRYSVYIYLINNETEVEQWTRMCNIVDKVIQMFDESVDLSSSVLGLTKACDIMRPVPGEIGKFSLNKSSGLVGEINLFCEKDITFRNY